MIRLGLRTLRSAKRVARDNKGSFNKSFSEGNSGSGNAASRPADGRPNPLANDAAKSPLFDRAKPFPEAGQGGAQEKTASTAGRIFTGIGNALFLGLVGSGAFVGYYTYSYTNDQIEAMIEETKEPENSFPGSNVWVWIMSRYAAQRARMETEVQKYSNPPSDRLLPDQHPQLRNVQTLVLDLDDLLIHSDWTRGRGWRTFKRPGASDLIRHMAPYYEVVVYTSQLSTYADPILDRLDPQHVIQYRLYRNATHYMHGRHMRDLSKLNRDLGKVLFVTADPEIASLHPDNTVVVKKWKLEADDTTLLDLIPFLEAVSSARHVDVREIVKSYSGQDIPTAFRERIKLTAERQRQQRQKNRNFFFPMGKSAAS